MPSTTQLPPSGPDRAPPLAPWPHSSGAAQSIELASRDGTLLHALLWRAERPIAGLLMLHGMQSHAGWFDVSGTPEMLAAHGVTVLAVDRRGSGRSAGERGHARSTTAFLDDVDAGRVLLARALPPDRPLHALANCFATRVLLPYIDEHPTVFRSIVVTAPAYPMSKEADYDRLEKLRIVVAGPHHRFATPLHDELFVSSGAPLAWIHDDALSLREVTAGFLRATELLTLRMKYVATRLDTPMLVVLGTHDAMVDNDAIRHGFVERYRGPVEVVELDAEHYIDFTDRQPELAAAISDWIHRRGGAHA